MQMVKRFFVGLLFVWGVLLLFMPKEEMYFRLEQELAKEGIEINEASTEESIFHFNLHDVSIYTKGIKVAHIDEVEFLTLLAYTRITVHGLDVDEGLKSMLPERIENLFLTYSMIAPLTVYIESKGSFGIAKGVLSLKERVLHMDFEKTKHMGAIQRYLKQGKKGWYYETTF
ncbi:MAG: hypothetical protein LGB07_03655 [Sulfurovum sp.]|nr:hypothetical protein [Sulfurovum sp.]MCB4749518.1 hypothetical protein [Sulfurovum sp.]MCB4751550.1 hypothetical protein [Sulfurovum sp.]MCB4753449.1 hypothetical protein [Sulfurovum sp.]MCB4758829.1 hypothetical protein [Sulfurovum sp.]